jgi:hypothetical protein
MSRNLLNSQVASTSSASSTKLCDFYPALATRRRTLRAAISGIGSPLRNHFEPLGVHLPRGGHVLAVSCRFYRC